MHAEFTRKHGGPAGTPMLMKVAQGIAGALMMGVATATMIGLLPVLFLFPVLTLGGLFVLWPEIRKPRKPWAGKYGSPRKERN